MNPFNALKSTLVLAGFAFAASASLAAETIYTEMPVPQPAPSRRNISESMWQPQSGRLAFTLTPQRGTVNAAATITDFDGKNRREQTVTGTSDKFLLGGQYGISKNFAAALNLGYTGSNTSIESKQVDGSLSQSESNTKGLDDVGLELKGRFPISRSFILLGGLGATFSPGEHTYNSTKDESNSYSGGNAYIPYAGAEWFATSRLVFGTQAKRAFKSDRKEIATFENEKLSSTESGGSFSSITLYSEFQSGFVLGLKGTMSWTDPIKSIRETGEVSSSMTAHQDAGASAYSRLSMGRNVDLIPELGYETSLESEAEGISSKIAYDRIDMFHFNLGLRIRL